MTKITYYLGAGASYYACPILEKQGEMMIFMSTVELQKCGHNSDGYGGFTEINFNENEKSSLPNHGMIFTLWYIGYFGKKAAEYNTIDTYARKLFLNEENEELSLLKFCVSVFFDLFENYKDRYRSFEYQNIDYRYKSLFSILIEKKEEIKLNNNFKFITWNYDLQLEESFNLFLSNNYQKDLNSINNYFKYKYNNLEINDIFHLNGYRGFYETDAENENILNDSFDFEKYWESIEPFYNEVKRKNLNFNNHIKYAWEHNLENNPFFENIYNVLNETEILIIIGYSFPPFNRSIDQLLFSKLNSKKIKKIVYQDPNASKQLIENLFEKPVLYKDKIEILTDSKDLKQFYLPNEHFISQKNTGIEIK
jgi:hypothetical protein